MSSANYMKCHGQTLDKVTGQQTSERAKKFLPLPEGEGRGEGERASIIPVILFAPVTFPAFGFRHLDFSHHE